MDLHHIDKVNSEAAKLFEEATDLLDDLVDRDLPEELVTKLSDALIHSNVMRIQLNRIAQLSFSDPNGKIYYDGAMRALGYASSKK